MADEDQNRNALILVSLAWLIVFIGRVTGPTLLKDIIRDIGITDVQAGFALSGLWFFYGIMQYPAGALSDTIGRKKVISLSLLGFGVGSILIGGAFNLIVLVFAFCFMGFGAGMLPSPSLTMLSELFGPKKGKALGIRSGVTSLSGLAPLILPLMALWMGWRNIFIFWGITGFLIAYLFYSTVQESLRSTWDTGHLDRLKKSIGAFRDLNVSTMFIVNLLISFAWIGMLSWFPTYIQETKGFNQEMAGIMFSVVLIGGLVLKPIIGHISDKVNHALLMMFLAFSGALSLYLLTLFDSLYALIGISLLFAQTGAFYPVRTSYLMDIWTSQKTGTKLGLFRSGVVLLGSPISAVIGWAKGQYSFDHVILMVALGLVIASIILLGKFIFEKRE